MEGRRFEVWKEMMQRQWHTSLSKFRATSSQNKCKLPTFSKFEMVPTRTFIVTSGSQIRLSINNWTSWRNDACNSSSGSIRMNSVSPVLLPVLRWPKNFTCYQYDYSFHVVDATVKDWADAAITAAFLHELKRPRTFGKLRLELKSHCWE